MYTYLQHRLLIFFVPSHNIIIKILFHADITDGKRWGRRIKP